MPQESPLTSSTPGTSVVVRERDRRLRLAVATSLLSKVTTAGVTLLAIPVGITALGEAHFALYSVVINALAWLRIAGLGVGPALTVNIAAAVASSDQCSERRLFSSAIIPISIVATVVSTVAMAFAQLGPVHFLVGEKLDWGTNIARTALAVLSVFVGLQIAMTAVDATQAGYQENYLLNIRQAISNILTLLAIIAASILWPTVVGLIVAANLFYYAAQVYNLVILVRRRPYLMPRLSDVDRRTFLALAKDGAIYAISGGVASYLCLQYPVLMAGHSLPHAETVLVSIGFVLVSQLFGLVSMFTVPLRPAIADAAARGECAWVERAYRKATLFTFLYATAIGILMMLGGSYLYTRVFHAQAAPSLLYLGAWTAFFVLYAWEYLHFSILYALPVRFYAAALWLGRSLMSLLITPLAVGAVGPAGYFAAQAIAIAIFSAIPMSYFARRALSNLRKSSAD